MSRKFVFIGAGSPNFSRALARDILSFPAFADATIALVDIDKRALEDARVDVQRIIDAGHYPAKLIATTDASLSDAEKHLRTVYSVLIIKTEQDLFGITDETVFIYDVARNRDAADRLLALLAGGCVSPANAKDVIDDLLCE